jgi:hypothetical protein
MATNGSDREIVIPKKPIRVGDSVPGHGGGCAYPTPKQAEEMKQKARRKTSKAK